jgi:hypothetical protein
VQNRVDSSYHLIVLHDTPPELSIHLVLIGIIHRAYYLISCTISHILCNPIIHQQNQNHSIYIIIPKYSSQYNMSDIRSKVTRALILFLSFIAFASYHKGTGSTAWLQWMTLIIFLVMGHVFDVAFTADNTFVFDPDADNWRRKTEAARQ